MTLWPCGLLWWFNRPQVAVVRTIVVQETQPERRADRILLNASGYVTARREATVSSKVTGKVVEVTGGGGHGSRGRPGAGAGLIRPTWRKNLRLAEAQLESARKALDETQANLNQAERDLRGFRSWLPPEPPARPSWTGPRRTPCRCGRDLERQTADVTVSECEVAILSSSSTTPSSARRSPEW